MQKQDPKKVLRKRIRAESDPWMNRQPAWLGRKDRTIYTGQSGIIYVRTINGRAIRVYNTAHVPEIFDLPVIIGRSRSMPGVWQIVGVRQVSYNDPVDSGQVQYHYHQHMFLAGDMVPIDRKQVLALSVIVSDAANFKVQVYGSLSRTLAGNIIIKNKVVDLSSYVVAIGARYVNIESDDDGILSINQGEVFGSPLIADASFIPESAVGKYMIATVLMYEGQTELLDEHIRVPMPLVGIIPKDVGTQIHEAETGTLADPYEIGFWNTTDNVFQKTTWADMLTLILPIVSAPQIVMEDGVTNPPVPIENSDGTDWLYSD